MRPLTRVRVAIDQHPTITDGVIAAVLSVLALLTVWLNWPMAQPAPLPGIAAVALTVLLMVPLTWRRRFPLAALAVMTPMVIVYRVIEVPEAVWSINAWWLALFSA